MHSQGSIEKAWRVLELLLKVRATWNKVNDLENSLADQHAKDTKVKDAI